MEPPASRRITTGRVHVVTVVTRCERGAAPLRQHSLVLAGATIAAGLIAHELGGSATVRCFPLLVATIVGVLTTLVAQRAAGLDDRGAPAATAALLEMGQLGMHLALSMPLSNHVDSIGSQPGPRPTLVLGLSCALIIAHTVAAGLLAILLLGAQHSVSLALHLLLRARHRCRTVVVLAIRRWGSLLAPMVPDPEWTTAALADQQWRYGPVRPRRGPPRALAGE